MTTSLSTENAANFRVKYFPPDRFTVFRPYWVQPVTPRDLTGEEIRAELKGTAFEGLSEVVISTVNRMEREHHERFRDVAGNPESGTVHRKS